MKKFVFAAICTFSLAGFVLADEFGAIITKVDGKSITYYKTKAPEGGAKGGKKGGGGFKAEKVGDAITTKVVDKVKVAKGVFDPDATVKGTLKAGDDIEGGLTSDAFKGASEDMPVTVRITVADDGKDKGLITQILQGGGKGGGKGGKKKGG